MPHLRLTSALILVAVGAGLLPAQSRNCTLLGRFTGANEGFNDVWGFVAADGREFCLLGSRTGTYVLDCSIPSSPRQTAYFANTLSAGWSASNTWKDIRTYGNYAYVVTEGGGGMQIIDLSNPDAPTLVTTFGQSIWSNAHNIAIDTATGKCYPCGTNVGVPVLDLSANPTNPPVIATWRTPYVHDLAIQDGIAHLAEISSGGYALLNVANLPALTLVSRVSGIPSCHNAWPSRDNRIAITTSERTDGDVTIVDISVPNVPSVITTWGIHGGTLPHNGYMQDRLCHLSYYSEGYQLLDLSDPPNPRRVAFYDTSTSGSGAWGCYPFQPSGNIYINDIGNGLFVVRPTPAPVRYGVGTPGSNGRVPAPFSFGASYIGNGNFKLEVDGAAANALAVLVIAPARSNVTVGGVNFLLDLSGPFLQVYTNTNSDGDATVAAPVPNDPSAIGQTLAVQWFVQDAGASAFGLSASRGLELTFVNP